MPLIPALGRQRQVDFWVQGQSGLQSEFQDSHGYTEKPCLEPHPHPHPPKKEKNVKETLLKVKSHIEPQILIMGEFSTPLSSLIRSSKQKQNREIATNTLQRKKKKLTKVMNQMNLIDICTKYIFLTPQGIFSKTKYMLFYKAILKRYKRKEITCCILWYHHGL
jgi:hypothetical protein